VPSVRELDQEGLEHPGPGGLGVQQRQSVSKPKTQEQLDREANKRLEKKFGVNLAWYDRKLYEQGGTCALCPSTEKTRRLHVDHDHKWTQIKIETKKQSSVLWSSSGLWSASAIYRGMDYVCLSEKKNLAIRDVKEYLKRDSVRGLLCYRCNKFIVGFGTPEKLRTAAAYLEAHQGVRNETEEGN
jgi:hypothetical protein